MSGAATNVGIEYQQRISALVLLATYLQLDLALFLQATTALLPRTVAFETSDAVDDLRIDCESGQTLYLQIKRTISLSEQPDSEFVKTIKQFVRLFLQTPNSKRASIHLVLVTTPKASNKVTEELRKLVESIRANPAAFTVNPLSKSERDTLAVLRRVISVAFLAERGSEAGEAEFTEFCRRVFISPVDVENTRSGENAVLMVLQSKGFTYPQLIWNYLISSALTFAGNRQSITSEALSKTLERFQVAEDDEVKLREAFSELLRPAVLNLQDLPAGKEVLLVSESHLKKLLLLELHRFDDDGSRRCRFTRISVRLKSGTEYPLVRRFASIEMAQQYLLENPGLIQGEDLVLIGANKTEGIEQTPFAGQHRQQAIDAFTNNAEPTKCLHCGSSCMQKDAYLTELDVEGLPFTVGLVCAEHVEPSDRLLGRSARSDEPLKYSPNIDTAAWLAAMQRGQGLLNAYRAMRGMPRGIQVVGWTDNYSSISDYSYCVKMNLADEAFKYTYVRGKIDRMPKSEAETQVAFFNSRIAEGKEAGDPWCIAEESWSFAPRSVLKRTVDKREAVLEVESTEVAKYSDILGRVYNRNGSYYAPLCIVRDVESEEPLVFSNGVPLLADPLRFPEFIDNWKRLAPEIDMNALKLSPLLDDNAFDAFMRKVTADNLVAVIDPTFDLNGHPDGGLLVQSTEKLIAAAQRRNDSSKRGKSASSANESDANRSSND
jgi:hypothetical protein